MSRPSPNDIVGCIGCGRPMTRADAIFFEDVYRCETCSQVQQVLECPRTWGSLARTNDPDVRHCGTCGRLVHRADSDASIVAHVQRGHCIHIRALRPSGQARTGGFTLGPNAAGADTAWLVVLDGPLRHAVIVLGGESVVVGSGPADVSIDIEALRLAPQHLRFVRADGEVRCHDLTRPDAPAVELRDGDIIALGDARAVFKTVRDMASPPDTASPRTSG